MSKNIFKLIKSDLHAAKKRDPAARSYLEILLNILRLSRDLITQGLSFSLENTFETSFKIYS